MYFAEVGLFALDLNGRVEGGIDDPQTLTPAVGFVQFGPSAPPTTVFVLDQGGILQVFDVVKPAAPAKVSAFPIPGTAGRLGVIKRIRVRGTRAYIAAGAEGIHLVDLSKPAQPVLVGSFKTMNPVRDLAVADSAIFLATGAEGIVILRQSR